MVAVDDPDVVVAGPDHRDCRVHVPLGLELGGEVVDVVLLVVGRPLVFAGEVDQLERDLDGPYPPDALHPRDRIRRIVAEQLLVNRSWLRLRRVLQELRGGAPRPCRRCSAAGRFPPRATTRGPARCRDLRALASSRPCTARASTSPAARRYPQRNRRQRSRQRPGPARPPARAQCRSTGAAHRPRTRRAAALRYVAASRCGWNTRPPPPAALSGSSCSCQVSCPFRPTSRRSTFTVPGAGGVHGASQHLQRGCARGCKITGFERRIDAGRGPAPGSPGTSGTPGRRGASATSCTRPRRLSSRPAPRRSTPG